jgi:hypothetical protein
MQGWSVQRWNAGMPLKGINEPNPRADELRRRFARISGGLDRRRRVCALVRVALAGAAIGRLPSS